MFVEHYGLAEAPFQLTPANRFFFGSKGHNRAIAHLIYGLSQKEGFIVITGEVGSGKTTLVERLWTELDRSTYTVARIVTTQVSGDDLLRLVLSGFTLHDQPADKATLLRQLEAFLLEEHRLGRRALLVVDEAQNLPFAALEELRMLSNITSNEQALLQTLLLGQPQFRRTLVHPDLEQLRQRILASCHLGPLSEQETGAYIEFRLKAAGWTGHPAWDESAFAAVYRHTGGLPRRINRLCSRVLLDGALEDRSEICADMVEGSAAELDQDLGHVRPPPAGERDLVRRVQALEAAVTSRERVLQRLSELLKLVAWDRRR